MTTMVDTYFATLRKYLSLTPLPPFTMLNFSIQNSNTPHMYKPTLFWGGGGNNIKILKIDPYVKILKSKDCTVTPVLSGTHIKWTHLLSRHQLSFLCLINLCSVDASVKQMRIPKSNHFCTRNLH